MSKFEKLSDGSDKKYFILKVIIMAIEETTAVTIGVILTLPLPTKL
jgi:hypothetical protein